MILNKIRRISSRAWQQKLSQLSVGRRKKRDNLLNHGWLDEDHIPSDNDRRRNRAVREIVTCGKGNILDPDVQRQLDQRVEDLRKQGFPSTATPTKGER
jgi:hypothetical protein